MKINLLKMKKLNMKKLSLVLYTAIFLIQPAFAQNAQIDKLLNKLDKTKGSSRHLTLEQIEKARSYLRQNIGI